MNHSVISLGFWSSEESQKSLALLLLHAAAIFFVCLFWSDVSLQLWRLPQHVGAALVCKENKGQFPCHRWVYSLCRCYITWHCPFSNMRVHFFYFSILDSPYTARNSSPQTQSSQDALTLMHLFCFIFFDCSGRSAVSQTHLVHKTKQNYIESEMRLFFWQSPDEQGFCAAANQYDRYMKNVTFLLTRLPSINSVPPFENHVLCSHGVTVVGLMSFSFFSSSSCLLLQVTPRL